MWPFLNHSSSCECVHCTPSTSLCYSGPNLPCTGIQNNETLSVALQKIDTKLCIVLAPITSTEIITALGYTPANDSNVVHKTGNEIVSGNKTFNDNVKLLGSYLAVNSQDNETGSITISTDESGLPYIQLGLTANENTATFRADDINTNSVYQLPNNSGIVALTSDIPTTPTLQQVTDVGALTTNPVTIDVTTDSGFALTLNNHSVVGPGYDGGSGIDINVGEHGDFALRANGTILTTKNITGDTIIKQGGTSSQFLKADGSVDSNTYALVETARPYKVYTALLTQAVTPTPPTAVVLENTLGGVVTFGYQSTGDFEILLPFTIDVSKTYYMITSNVSERITAQLYYNGGNSLGILVFENLGIVPRTLVDGFLEDTPVEIRVYN